MRKLKKWDPVVVIAWKFKGAKSHIVKIEDDKVFLHDVNKVKMVPKVKMVIPWQWFISRPDKWKGFVEKEASIHISNIAYLEWDKATKVAVKIDEKTGKKVRISKKTGKTLPNNERNA